MSKNILIIALLVIATMGLIATAGYILQRQAGEEVKKPEGGVTIPEKPEELGVQPTKTPSILETTPETTPTKPGFTSQPEVDTSNWKTFRSEGAQFELKYPPEISGFARGVSCPAGRPCGFIAFDFPLGYQYQFMASTFKLPVDKPGIDGRRPLRPDECIPLSALHPETYLGEQKRIGEVEFVRSAWIISTGMFVDFVDIEYTGQHKVPVYNSDLPQLEHQLIDICYRFRYSYTNRDKNLTMEQFENSLALFEQIVASFKLLESGGE